jgi:hypothetical protein
VSTSIPIARSEVVARRKRFDKRVGVEGQLWALFTFGSANLLNLNFSRQ